MHKPQHTNKVQATIYSNIIFSNIEENDKDMKDLEGIRFLTLDKLNNV